MATSDLTAQHLRELLHYDPETGLFVWKVKASKRVWIGKTAGSIRHGYTAIQVLRDTYMAHRLAWLYVHGVWPSGQIDHINGIKRDNRVCNLRDVSGFTNQQNRRSANSNSKCGVLGVSWVEERKKWAARITVNGRSKRIGRFDSIAEAHAAYVLAKRKLHEGNTL